MDKIEYRIRLISRSENPNSFCAFCIRKSIKIKTFPKVHDLQILPKPDIILASKFKNIILESLTVISKYRTKETGLSLRENMIINPAKDKKITIEENKRTEPETLTVSDSVVKKSFLI